MLRPLLALLLLAAPLATLARSPLAPGFAAPAVASPPVAAEPLREGFPCGWTAPDGTVFDFSGLKTAGGVQTEGDADDIYKINMCGIAEGDGPSGTCASESAMICMQYTWSPSWFAIAKFSNTPSSSPPKYSLVDPVKGAAAGVKLTIANGAYGPTNANVDIELYCTPGGADSYKAIHDQTPHWTVTIRSAKACGTAGGGGKDGDGEGGLSGGWAFIIILICVTFVYVVGGCLFKRHRQGTQGMESCPNIDFWRDLPGLLKDGCLYSLQKTKDLIARCQGKPTGSGETYQEFK